MLPLTRERPKALCPVAGRPLVDRALARLGKVIAPGSVAVNAWHFADAVVAHVGDRAHLSVESQLLGTGGGLGALRGWLDGRGALVVNVDAEHDADLGAFVEGWDGQRLRFLVGAERASSPASLRPGVPLAAVLMPPAALQELAPERCSVYDRVWQPWEEAGRVDVVAAGGPVVDCGTPGRYLAANLWRSQGRTVVGERAVVQGEAAHCVLWEGAVVAPGERLDHAIRTSAGRTVLVRRL